MAFITADRIKETTTVTGTGPITLLGAVSGYRPFSSVMLSIGDTCPYAIVNADASQWEVGIATYTDVNTLTRTTIHASTADPDTDPVDFTAGVKDVFLAPTARTVLSDITSNDGTVTLTKVGPIVDLSVAIAAATENVIVQVRNTTGATLTKGTVVYINDALGQLPTVAKALATSDATSAQTLGMISADLNDNSNGYVTIIGLIDDISLDTGIYSDGDQLYLSGTTAGAFTNVKPYAPTHLVYVGVVEHAHNVHGKIFVKVQNGYELDELHNVSAQSPSNGQTIVYNSTNQLWEKNTVSLTAGVNGILPVTNGGTGVTTATGTGSVVLSSTPTLVTPKTNSIAAVPVVSGAGNSLTLAAGSGVGTGAGGSLVLQAGIQATSGGDGKVVVKQVAGQTSNLQEWQLSNSTVIGAIDANGNVTTKLGTLLDGCIFVYSGSATNGDVIFGTKLSNGTPKYLCGFSGVTIKNDAYYRWSSGNDAISTADLYLYRDAAATLAQRNGTNPQSFRVYNTYTDASNWERLNISWSSNLCTIGLEKGGTGTNRTMRIDMGGNPNTGGNYIEAVATNYMKFVTGGVNTFWLSNGGSAGFFQYYYAGQTVPIYFGQNSGGNTNRVSDKWVLRAYGGTGNTAPTYIGFGAAYSGVSGSAAHTQEDCFLVRLLASATPIVAFGSDFLSTVPAIKRTGTRLISRLADDSGYATWEGPLNSNTVNAIALPSAATVTAASGDGTTITYTAANTFSVGQIVSVTGLTTTTGSSLNIANMTIATASSTQFTVANTTVGTAAATQAGTATIQSAGNSVTISAGNGSGVGAGGNIILQPGAQGTSGGDGIVQCTKKLQFYTGSSKTDLAFQINNTTTGMWYNSGANMFVWTINNTDTICFRQGYIRLSKGGGIYWSNTTNDAITVSDDTAIYSASRGVFAVDASMQSVNPQGGSLAFKSFTTTQAANVNDWVMGPSAFQRVNCTTASSITGIAPYTSGVHVDGRMIRIYNVGAANLTLSHNSASSAAANKFWNSTGADIVLSTHQYVELIYDSTDNGRGGAGWRVSSVH